MDCICFSIARQINITYTLPPCKPIESSNGREFDSWSISVSFRLSETCEKDAQGRKEQTKPCFKIYILCIIRVGSTVSSSVHWLKAAVTSPT